MYKFEYKLSSSFFCNLRELDAKNKGTFKGLMDAFGDLDIIPSTFQEVSPTGVSLRPQLQIDSLNVVVEFQSEKIVITKRCQSFPFDAAEFSKNFISTSLDIVSKFLRIYNKKFTRLSLINEYLFDPDSINVNETHNKVFSDTGCRGVPFEWSFRDGVSESHNFEGLNEDLNLIRSLKRVQGTVVNNGLETPFDTLAVTIDINTKNEKTADRFELSHSRSFLELTDTFANEMRNNLDRLVNSEA